MSRGPEIVRTTAEMISLRKSWAGQSIGLVPTMGALHEGHKTLLQKARAENDICVLTLFVNPTQFNNPQDLAKYPSTWESDVALASGAGVDVIFAPDFSEMYPDKYRYQVIENEFSKALCGQDRPGHFDGVLSVVMKLFNLTMPAKAYFGEKDFQQLSLIQGMVKAFFMNVTIVPVPTVREKNGLALSSRNLRLSPELIEKAPLIFKSLTTSATANEAAEKLSQAGFKVDYVQDIENRRFAAAHLGEVRLIDNVEI